MKKNFVFLFLDADPLIIKLTQNPSNQSKINIHCGLVWKPFITNLVGPFNDPHGRQELLKGPLHDISEPIKKTLTAYIKHSSNAALKVE